jgi:hypothetical protein
MRYIVTIDTIVYAIATSVVVGIALNLPMLYYPYKSLVRLVYDWLTDPPPPKPYSLTKVLDIPGQIVVLYRHTLPFGECIHEHFEKLVMDDTKLFEHGYGVEWLNYIRDATLSMSFDLPSVSRIRKLAPHRYVEVIVTPNDEGNCIEVMAGDKRNRLEYGVLSTKEVYINLSYVSLWRSLLGAVLGDKYLKETPNLLVESSADELMVHYSPRYSLIEYEETKRFHINRRMRLGEYYDIELLGKLLTPYVSNKSDHEFVVKNLQEYHDAEIVYLLSGRLVSIVWLANGALVFKFRDAGTAP